MRKTAMQRKTAETDISAKLCIDGSGKYSIDTGCGFLDHMLELFTRHGSFDLELSCKGDTHVDYHHTAEDIGIVLGSCFLDALGDMKGITRYGYMLLPMDEALILTSVDISGRAHLEYGLEIPTQKIGDFDTELVREFFEAFVRTSKLTLHLRQVSGFNSHHITECAFKSFARALAAAAAVDEKHKNEIPSTKGTLL
ncbi:MAG: imidazoleglycerol-phosphate dehydratase HisB [Clostridia bacterium]|nr:imidazoleglycerol-phosphate dehydratase HisB [Clostridia bacterium]